MGPRAYLRKRLMVQGFLLEGRPWHDRFLTIARPVEKLLSAFMKMPDRKAPIFILGPQRSGTTLFYKGFQRHLDVCYFDQAVDYFPDAFITASILMRAIGANENADHLERHDLKKDLWIRTWKNHGYAYTEGNRVWNRLGPDGLWRSEEHRAWAKRFFPRLVHRLHRYTGKPVFLNKCPANALRINQLVELFPGARFIHVERDPRGVINSIHNIHRSLNVRSWGPMPVPEGQLEGLTEYERITRQWIAITGAISEGLGSIPAERRFTVRYEDFMHSPERALNDIAQHFGLGRFKGPLGVEIKADRADGWKSEIPADELARVERMLTQAGYGQAMRQTS